LAGNPNWRETESESGQENVEDMLTVPPCTKEGPEKAW
jgi:hypothetical protein